jgi:hypothetical protein
MLKDDQWSFNTITCICKSGYSGDTCDVKDTRIDISFDDVKIPQSLSLYFITVQTDNDPLITKIAKKISFGQDTTTLFTSLLFNLVFVRINDEYYLVFQQINVSHLLDLKIEIKISKQCFSIDKLLDNRTLSFPLLHRAKYYHVACLERLQLTCLYDLEQFMCLCNEDRFANCFQFYFKEQSVCQG